MKISVVIPSYNVENFIEESVQSVIEQTYAPLELICVDNNSTDNTYSILEKMSGRLNFRLLKEQRQGAPFARNKGLKVANGEYIQFLDADDLLKPEKISEQAAIIKSAITKPDIVIGNYIEFDINREVEYKIKFRRDNLWLGLADSRAGITSSNLWKKSSLIEAGCWDENAISSQDTRLLFELLKKRPKVEFSSDYNTIKRVRAGGSISKTNESENWERYLRLRIDIVSFLSKELPDEYAKIEDDLIQALFPPIRNLYQHNPEKSIQFHKKYFRGHKLRAKGSVSRVYKLTYDLFGFRVAQMIKMALG